jgi:hypothetical protein
LVQLSTSYTNTGNMNNTVIPLLDWNPADDTWEEFRYAAIDLDELKLITYSTVNDSKIITWDDWSQSFKQLLGRTIYRSGFPIAICKNEEPDLMRNEFFIINNESDAVMALLMFQ